MSDYMDIDVPAVSPAEAWEGLKSSNAALVDVRTIAEWDYVGEPMLETLNKEALKVEWMEFPEDTINGFFAAELLSQLSNTTETLYFLCRSGRRSLRAAQCILAKIENTAQTIACINIAEGFEGDHDVNKHRANLNGWKYRGLPWTQP